MNKVEMNKVEMDEVEIDEVEMEPNRKHIIVSKEEHMALKMLAAKLGRSMRDIANELITNRIKELENGDGRKE